MDYGSWVSGLRDTLGGLGAHVVAHAPTVLTALALLVVGWLLARLLGGWTRRLLARLDRLGLSRRVDSGLRRIGVERPVEDLVGSLLFWLVLLLFVIAATEVVGLPVVAMWLSGLARYLPHVLLAALIVFAGILGGALAREAIATAAGAAGVVYADVLGRLVQIAIFLVAGVTAVDQLGIDSRFLTAAIVLVVGAVAGGVALAFGLGARTAVSNIIAAHYLRQAYRVGQTVRVGPAQGRIVEFTSTGVILEAEEGRVHVPAREFSEGVSVLLRVGA